MNVKLVGYTQPTKEFMSEGMQDVQDLISFCARVSNPSNQMNMETTEKLLNYLAKHKHWSPFEMASATMEIETTRDIARQMLRHRSFAFQEFSQRYADPADFGEQFVVREARLQDTNNRQNSIETDDLRLAALWAQYQQKVIDQAKDAYKWAINNGIAKEQARAVLPEGNTKSRLYMQGTIRSWIHFIDLRSGNGTQKEHIEVAKACAEAIVAIFPLAEKYVSE
jgi:thymidylate synthase (FAD)